MITCFFLTKNMIEFIKIFRITSIDTITSSNSEFSRNEKEAFVFSSIKDVTFVCMESPLMATTDAGKDINESEGCITSDLFPSLTSLVTDIAYNSLGFYDGIVNSVINMLQW